MWLWLRLQFMLWHDHSSSEITYHIACPMRPLSHSGHTKQVCQQDAYPANGGGGGSSYYYVQHSRPFSRATTPSLIVCLYLAYSKLWKLTAASNAEYLVLASSTAVSLRISNSLTVQYNLYQVSVDHLALHTRSTDSHVPCSNEGRGLYA